MGIRSKVLRRTREQSAVTSRAPSGRILELDGLRGIAVLLVVLFHYFSIFPTPPDGAAVRLKNIFQMGWCGVDLFFILSGFLIGGILLEAKGSDRYFQTFYRRRVYRISPIYYLWIGLYFLLTFVILRRLPGWLPRDKWTVIPIFVLFLQNTWPRGPAMSTAWLNPLWSLAVEEQFYLVMPTVIRFLSRSKLVLLLMLTVLLAPAARVMFFESGHPQRAYMLTACRADALAIGVLLAIVWRNERAKALLRSHPRHLYGVLMLLPGVIYLAMFKPSQFGLAMDLWGFSCIDWFFAGLMLLTLVTPNGTWAALCKWPLLRNIGRVSYCIYIIHAAVNTMCHSLLSASNEGISTLTGVAATILAAGIAWIAAKTSWRFFESPLIRRSHFSRY